MSLLSEISVTIDTREQNQKRISSVESWALKHGAIVEHSALKLCDYKIEGTFNDVDMNLGIEAKSLQDFAGSYQDLPDKLARSYELYSEVALFIEVGSYTFTPDPDDFHATIINPAVRNGDADVLPLAVFENMIASFQHEGIHVRQLRSEAHFPYAIANLLISITKPIHSGLHIKQDNHIRADYLNVLGKVPGIGYKTGLKLLQNYPNFSWLCNASEPSLQEVMGRKVGKKVYDFIHDETFVTKEWKAGYHKDGTPLDEPLPEDKDNESPEAMAYDGKPQRYTEIPANKTDKNGTPLNTKPCVGYEEYCPCSDYGVPRCTAAKNKLQSSSAGQVSNVESINKIGLQANENAYKSSLGTPDTSSYPGTTFLKDSIPQPYVPVDNPQGIPQSRNSPPIIPGDTTFTQFVKDQGDPEEAAKGKNPCCPGDTTDKVPKDKKMDLTAHLKIWFQEPHSMMETQLMYGLEGKVGAWSSKSVFDAVLAGEKSGYLRVFSQKGERYYVVAVKAQPELNVGV